MTIAATLPRRTESSPQKQGNLQSLGARLREIPARSSTDEKVDSEFLWGLYRHRVREGCERYTSLFPLFDWTRSTAKDRSSRFRLLKGLIGWQREGGAKELQLLYLFRFGDLEQADSGKADRESDSR